MSGHKAQHGKHDQPSGPKRHEDEEKSTNRHVYVEPGAQIDFVKEVREEYRTAQNESAAQNKKQLFWTKISAFLLLVYVGVTLLIYRANQQSNDISRQSLDVVQRAIISFAPDIKIYAVIDSRVKPIPVVAWNFPVPIENLGSTPAKNIRFAVNGNFLMGALPDDFSFHDSNKAQTTALPPKTTTYAAPLAVGPNQIELVQRGVGHLYMYGWATYHDVFPGTPEHVTMFCYELTVFSKNPRTPIAPDENGGVVFSFCKRHNCTDEDCKNEKGPPYELPLLQ
jgi:hypothetical protein